MGVNILSKNTTEKWLRKNDPVFSSRRTTLDYPYLTSRQIRERSEREIPVSNLNYYFKNITPEKRNKEIRRIIELFS